MRVAAVVVSAVAVVISLASAVVSVLSYKTARRAFLASQASSSSYLFDSFRYKPKGEGTAYVACLEIRNEATIANSLVQVEARVRFVSDLGSTLMVLQHNENSPHLKDLQLQNLARLPVALAARGAIRATLIFDFPRSTAELSTIDEIEIEVRFAAGPPLVEKCRIVTDLTDAAQVEDRRRKGTPL